MKNNNKNETARWATASLCIYSETVSVGHITSVLGIPPTYCHEKGDAINSSRRQSWRQESAWILATSTSEDEDLTFHLEWLLGIVEGRVAELKLLAPDCRVKLRCGFASTSGQGGTTLTKALLARLALTELDLTLDLYPPEANARNEDIAQG